MHSLRYKLTRQLSMPGRRACLLHSGLPFRPLHVPASPCAWRVKFVGQTDLAFRADGLQPQDMRTRILKLARLTPIA